MNKAQQLGILVSDRGKQKLFDYDIPHRMHGGILRYVEQGVPPGDFLTAVINNDLRRAVDFADEENKRLLPAYIMWFYNWAPAGCWGYETAVRDWCKPLPEPAEHET